MSFVNMRIKEFFANRWTIVLAFFTIAIAMWILTFLSPECIDDYWYKFVFIDKSVDMNRPITSVKDVIISQYAHYFYVNGRSIVHTIVQLFAGILGKSAFNICNATVFALFIYMLTRLCSKITVLNLIFIFTVVLFLYPVWGQTVLWMTGSINYLWSSTAVCAFLYALDKLKYRPLTDRYFFLGVLCLFVGWTHEGITFPLAISLIIYALIYRKTIRHQAIFPLFVGFIIGSMLCAFSPGTLAKGNLEVGINIYQLLQKIYSGLTVCLKLRAFWILICIIVIFCYTKRNMALQWLKEQYIENLIICNALLFSFGVIFMSGFVSTRSGIGVDLFSIILLLRTIMSIDLKRSKAIKIIICAGGGFLYSCILFWSIENHKDVTWQIMPKIESRKSDIILYENMKYPSFVDPYIVKLNKDSYYESMWNQLIATTYHYERIAFIPMSVYKDITSHSEQIMNITKQKEYPFYVVPVESHDENVRPYFILSPTDYNSLPFYIKPFASKLDRYSATEVPVTTNFGILDIEGQNYLFVEKNDMIDNRVKNIILVPK